MHTGTTHVAVVSHPLGGREGLNVASRDEVIGSVIASPRRRLVRRRGLVGWVVRDYGGFWCRRG